MSNYLQTSLLRNDYDPDIYPFVIVAHISAALNEAQDEAKKLSLTAKNARTLAMRAGEQASGFKVITNYIDEFAQQIIAFASQIQSLSVKISECARQVSFINDFCNRVELASSMTVKAADKEQLERYRQSQATKMISFQLSFTDATEQLESLLDDIETQMRAANFIALTAKVEAVASPDYVDNLNNVAVSIADIAQAISISTRHCFQCLTSYREN